MVISEETRKKILAKAAQYPEKSGAVLPALAMIQKQTGFITTDIAGELAELLEVKPIQVMEVVSFYNMFFDKAQGKHHAYVCTNLPCALKGARNLVAQLEAHLGVHAGGTTEDGRITFGHEECLGACAYAPMMRVDDTYYEDLDLEKAKKILDGLE